MSGAAMTPAPAAGRGSTTRPVRVVHVIDNLGPGGKERQLVELLKGCAQDGGFDSLVVCMQEGVFWDELPGITRLELDFLLRRWRRDPTISWRLSRRARRFGADVLVAWEPMTAVYAVPVCRLGGIPLINYMIQDAPARLRPRVARRARLTFPFSDLIVGNSAAGLVAYGVTGPRGDVVRNGYDARRAVTTATPAAVRAHWNLPDGRIIGMVANFRATKDQPTLVAAAEHVLARHPDALFVFGGGGETMDRSRALAARIAPDRIRFLGPVGEGLEDLVSTFTIGALATFTEGISNSLMEYMALGKPVVATAGGGTCELVVDGETGILVPPGDPAAMAAAITALLDDPDRGARMGAAGRNRIEEHFSLQNLVDEFRRVCLRVRPDLARR